MQSGHVEAIFIADAPEKAPRDIERARAVAGRGSLGELPDLEDLGAAVRAGALNSRATVLHGHLLRVLDLYFLAFLYAITFSHRLHLLSGVGASGRLFSPVWPQSRANLGYRA